MNKSASKRIFFALWPDDNVRRSITSAFQYSTHAKLKGSVYKPHNLHITLHFLGNVKDEMLECVVNAASKVKVPGFEIRLDRFGSFDKARIFWLGPSSIPFTLSQLHSELSDALIDCNYKADKRPFSPHVTLLRKAQGVREFDTPDAINWQINQFALIESIQVDGGVEYRPIHFYDLIT